MFTMSPIYVMIQLKGCVFLKFRTFSRLGIMLLLLLSLCLSASAASYSSLEALIPGCSETDWDVLRQTNQRRLQKGMTPFSTFPALHDAAEVRAAEISSSFSHTRPNGSRCFTVLTESGLYYSSAAENIAAGQTSPANVLTAWMNSEGHRDNILSEKTVHLGAANYYGSRNNWVQLFMNYKCSFDAMEILIGPKGTMLQDNQTLDDLDLIVKLHCTVHGDCYMPLLKKMCTVRGNNVTVTYDNLTAAFKLGELASVSEDGFTALLQNNQAILIGCSRTETALTLPQTICGYPVASIAAGAFQNAPNLRHLYVPSVTVTAAAEAFTGTDITIWAAPDAVISQQAPKGSTLRTYGDTVLQVSTQEILLTTWGDYSDCRYLVAAYDANGRMLSVQTIGSNRFTHLPFPSSDHTNRMVLFRLNEQHIPLETPKELWHAS